MSVGAVRDVPGYEASETVELLVVLDDNDIITTKTYYLVTPFDLFECETKGYESPITE